jgi:hypothetical protein
VDEGCAGGEVRYGYFRLSEDRCIRVICMDDGRLGSSSWTR